MTDNEKPQDNFIIVDHINAYLIPGPDIYVTPRATPFYRVPAMNIGSSPIDNGNLLLTIEEHSELIKRNPAAEKWIRLFMGGDEFINRKLRYCLWLEGCPPDELRKMPLVYERVKNVREFRLKSKRPRTRKAADEPTLFAERRQPTSNFLLIPKTSSERRRYIPIGFLTPEIIVSDAALVVPDADLFLFGMLTSSVHMAWVRLVAGRLTSRIRYSNTICYNCFPFPLFYPDEYKPRVETTARKILDARKNYPNASYADLYDEISMPSDLRKAHAENDLAVLSLYGRLKPDMPEMLMQVELLYMYAALLEHFGEDEEED